MIIGTYAKTASTGTAAPLGTTGDTLGGPLGPLGAVGGMDGGAQSFLAPFAGILHITIDDCCRIGDVYQAFVDGLTVGFTSVVQLGGPSLSSGIFDIPITAGSHSFDVADILLQYIGFAPPFGSADGSEVVEFDLQSRRLYRDAE